MLLSSENYIKLILFMLLKLRLEFSSLISNALFTRSSKLVVFGYLSTALRALDSGNPIYYSTPT